MTEKLEPIAEKQKIIAGLGFTPKQHDLAEYQLIKYGNLVQTDKWQNLKSSLSIATKNELMLLSIILLHENYHLVKNVMAEIQRTISLPAEKDTK